MKTPAIVVCVLGCFLAFGCRTNPKITMLEQECRMHEDRIYALQDQLQMMQSALRDAKRENESLLQQGADAPILAPSSRSSNSSKQAKPHADAPVSVDVQIPGAESKEVSPDILENMGAPSSSSPSSDEKPSVRDPNALPSLETPSAPPLKQDWISPADSKDSVESIRPGRPVETQTRVENGKVLYRQEGPQLRGDSRDVKKITVSKMMTGGVNADGLEGDEGIFMVVEPRDDQGKLVPAVGSVSIVAVDPALPEEKARLARWSFSEKEVANQFRRSGSAEGFHLEVRWPDAPPRHENLQLFVRYTTADSRKLYAEVPIQVALAPKTTTVVARPSPRYLDDKSKGWATKPMSERFEEVVSRPASSTTDSSSRVASAPAQPIRQAIPPVNSEPIYTKRPVTRPRPVWSPER